MLSCHNRDVLIKEDNVPAMERYCAKGKSLKIFLLCDTNLLVNYCLFYVILLCTIQILYFSGLNFIQQIKYYAAI